MGRYDLMITRGERVKQERKLPLKTFNESRQQFYRRLSVRLSFTLYTSLHCLKHTFHYCIVVFGAEFNRRDLESHRLAENRICPSFEFEFWGTYRGFPISIFSRNIQRNSEISKAFECSNVIN